MMKHIDGNGKYLHRILRVTTSRLGIKNRSNLALLTRQILPIDIGYGAIITTNPPERNNVILLKEDEYVQFHDKDIIETNEDGINFLWEHDSDDNCFFLTEMCSCNCVMCPQPPKPHDKIHEYRINKTIDLIHSSYTKSICVTGGEPTLLEEFYLNLMFRIRQRFPKNTLITLTNGKSFSNLKFLNKFHRLNLKSIVAVSLCADVDVIHDTIVRAKGSFNQTQQGLYNLAKANEWIELRFVICKQNYKRLPYFADFVYKNFPFVTHIALMGMEYIGYASDNYDDVYINPLDYSNELMIAVKKLNRYGMFVSVYNIPLCLMNKKIRKFSYQSISKWKNAYLPECMECSEINKCAGIFTTSRTPYQCVPIKI